MGPMGRADRDDRRARLGRRGSGLDGTGARRRRLLVHAQGGERCPTQGEHAVVGEAGDGVEAIARFQELKPDLTTLDITTPEKDGIAALKTIIALDRTARAARE